MSLVPVSASMDKKMDNTFQDFTYIDKDSNLK